jgi:hypothetical protein
VVSQQLISRAARSAAVAGGVCATAGPLGLRQLQSDTYCMNCKEHVGAAAAAAATGPTHLLAARSALAGCCPRGTCCSSRTCRAQPQQSRQPRHRQTCKHSTLLSTMTPTQPTPAAAVDCRC